VLIVEAVQQLNQNQLNWIAYRSTCQSLKHEKYLYLAGAGPYGNAERRGNGLRCSPIGTTGAVVMIAQTVSELLADHVRLTVKGIDRMYLNRPA
jgi:hypothetical protein